MKKDLYGLYYLNFARALPREMLELLAQTVAELGLVDRVPRVYDQYLNYVCIESNLYLCNNLSAVSMLPSYTNDDNILGTYKVINSRNSTEKDIRLLIDYIADCIFCTLVTLGGQLPLIVTKNSEPSTTLARALDQKLRDHLMNSKGSLGPSAFGKNTSNVNVLLQRPILHILDRDFDLSVPLRHPSAYNSLIHDLLGINSNRISCTVDDGKATKKISFDIDPSDGIWADNSGLAFPKATENLDALLTSYRADKDTVTKSTGGKDLVASNLDSSGSMTADELKIAISVIPELTNRKRLLDGHLQVSSAVLNKIKEREWPLFYGVEQEIIRCAGTSEMERVKQSVFGVLKQDQVKREDKLRLLLVYLLMNPKEDISHEIGRMGFSANATVEYIQRYISMKITTATSPLIVSSPKQTGDFMDHVQRLTGKLTTASGALTSILMTSLGMDTSDSPICKHIDAVLESLGALGGQSIMTSFSTSTGSNILRENLIVYDPLLQQSIDSNVGATSNASPYKPSTLVNQRSAYSNYHLFLLGGITYTEYNAASEHLSKKRGFTNNGVNNVMIGTSEILNGYEFVEMLGSL